MHARRPSALIYLILLSLSLTVTTPNSASAGLYLNKICSGLLAPFKNQGDSSSPEAKASEIQLKLPLNRLIEAAPSPGHDRAWEATKWGRYPHSLRYNGLVLYKENYEAFRDAALAVHQITQGQPLITVGRSPAPIATFNSIVRLSETMTLPLSNFRHCMDKSEELNLNTKDEKQKACFAELPPEQLSALFEHFDKTIGAQLKNKTGKIFVVDLGLSGASLFATTQHLKAYAKARELPLEFEPILLTLTQFSDKTDFMARYFKMSFHKLILDKNKYVEEALKDSPWDRFAEFDAYQFDLISRTGSTRIYNSWEGGMVDLPTGQPNPAYVRFKTAVHANILNDEIAMRLWKDPIAFDVHIDGIYWDETHKVYRDQEGTVWRLATD